MNETPGSPRIVRGDRRTLQGFRSAIVDRMRSSDNVWPLPGGQIVLPRTFGFCRGVEHALTQLEQTVQAHAGQDGKLFLLGQIIHNPWVNEYFQRRGVRMLQAGEIQELERHVGAADCAVIPAFGVPLPIERRLRAIGCRIVDTSCGDVRRLWVWAERAVSKGYGIFIFGRPTHDETVVTKSRLAAAGGGYVVARGLQQTQQFCDLVAGRLPAEDFQKVFPDEATNAEGLGPFLRLAQVSQTTMLHEETMRVRRLLRGAFQERFGPREAQDRLLFEPTVCRATQDRQSAAIELCQGGCDLVIVVGGFGSSNTTHLYELARSFGAAYFIEDASAVRSRTELATFDVAGNRPVVARDWLPGRRPLRIGVLAGASSPEIVVGAVVQRLAEFLDRAGEQ